ncbi:perlucin-like protein [Mercenaria mercenaria]|uniref:perlucin-like protein n=1 Tax=Mercenaria mercenaria TaxID=6596 RepID=UPI00234E5A64|nr:perlucin-like protein [Mercenaria mercenaria]
MSSVSICGIDGQWTLEDFTCPTVFACPDGWEMFQDSCYLFVDSCKSFTNAENNCRSLDARLVHVESGEENTFLRSYLSGLPMADYWIGMTDEDQEGNWKWYGNGVDVQFFDWKPGEASSNRHENCAVFGDTISYTWADVACGSRRKSVCEMTNPE